MRHLRYVLIAVACVGISLGFAFAQEDPLGSGVLRGEITDLTPAQAPIEGVEVKIVAQDTGKEYMTKTNADGNYEQSGLPAGPYLISISKEEYNERTGEPVTVVDGGKHFVPFKMTRKGDIEPFFEARSDEGMSLIIIQRIVSLIQRVAEGVGKRYALDETVINVFHQSILGESQFAILQFCNFRNRLRMCTSRAFRTTTTATWDVLPLPWRCAKGTDSQYTLIFWHNGTEKVFYTVQ